MVMSIPRPRLRFRPPVTASACSQEDSERSRDAAPLSLVPMHSTRDHSEWVRVLDVAGARWKG
eukprot:3585472-Rhodomonas_salina.1